MAPKQAANKQDRTGHPTAHILLLITMHTRQFTRLRAADTVRSANARTDGSIMHLMHGMGRWVESGVGGPARPPGRTVPEGDAEMWSGWAGLKVHVLRINLALSIED